MTTERLKVGKILEKSHRKLDYLRVHTSLASRAIDSAEEGLISNDIKDGLRELIEGLRRGAVESELYSNIRYLAHGEDRFEVEGFASSVARQFSLNTNTIKTLMGLDIGGFEKQRGVSFEIGDDLSDTFLPDQLTAQLTDGNSNYTLNIGSSQGKGMLLFVAPQVSLSVEFDLEDQSQSVVRYHRGKYSTDVANDLQGEEIKQAQSQILWALIDINSYRRGINPAV